MDKQEFIQRLKDQPFSVLSDLVYQYIADGIIDVTYAPGSKINTKRISEELGISRTPVRTALERLVADKLVEQVGDKGFKVSAIDWKDCLALFDIRAMLEGTSAYVAANTITDGQLAALKQNILQAKALADKGNFPADIPAFNRLDLQFHELIVRAAGNSYYITMFNTLKPWIIRYTNSMVASGSLDGFHPDLIVTKHAALYRAIKSRYSTVAKTEMEDHLRHIYHVLYDSGLLFQSQTGKKV